MEDPISLIMKQLEALVLLNKQVALLTDEVLKMKKELKDQNLLNVIHQQEIREMFQQSESDDEGGIPLIHFSLN